ncbi:MAG: hypothetical protein HRT73_05015 [Flavobacteriales bacterium]|nr:hypothetical protein [Flavobacteriales bacterium]
MNYFSYKIEHDFGLAPNPFGGYCTLAVCRGQIRANKRLEIGDWIIGTGSRALEHLSGLDCLHHIIFAMKLEEKITFNEYWQDPRFQYKIPELNGSLVQMYGDNIYHQDTESNEWIQANSAHSLESGEANIDHVNRDTKSDSVLISKTFYYFGDQLIRIPEELLAICCEGRGIKSSSIPSNVSEGFIEWLTSNFEAGIHGDPINWCEHNNTINKI